MLPAYIEEHTTVASKAIVKESVKHLGHEGPDVSPVGRGLLKRLAELELEDRRPHGGGSLDRPDAVLLADLKTTNDS